MIVIPCRRCGYNLIGQSLLDHRCPECGTPSRFSYEGDQLCHADPAWVATLATGGRMVFWGLVITVLDFIGEGAGVFRAGHGLPGSLAELLSDGLWYAGAWLLATGDPSGMGEAEYGRARRTVRWAVPFGVAGQLAAAAGWSAAPPWAVHAGLSTAEAVGAAADVVATIALLRYASRLALRASDYALFARADTLVYWFGVPLAAVELMVRLIPPNVRWWPLRVICVGLSLTAVPLILTGPMYLLATRRLAKRLREQAILARQAWAEA